MHLSTCILRVAIINLGNSCSCSSFISTWILRVGLIKELLFAFTNLAMTTDPFNTTLHTIATQENIDVVNLLLETHLNLAKISKIMVKQSFILQPEWDISTKKARMHAISSSVQLLLSYSSFYLIEIHFQKKLWMHILMHIFMFWSK